MDKNLCLKLPILLQAYFGEILYFHLLQMPKMMKCHCHWYLIEEKDKEVAIRATNALINELNEKKKAEGEETITDNKKQVGKRGEVIAESTKFLIKKLKQKEEQIKSETNDLINKIQE